MANTKNTARQYPLYAVAVLGPNNGTSTQSIVLPPGAVVIGGLVKASVAGAAALKLNVLDSAASPLSLFGAAAVDALTAVPMPTAGLGAAYPAGTTLNIALSASDNAAVVSVTVGYVIAGRQNEAYTA